MIVSYLLVGALAGSLSGLFGIGGGVIVVPALSWIFLAGDTFLHNSAMKSAIATSLAVMIMTLMSSVLSHARQKTLRWDYFFLMFPMLIIGTFVGACSAHLLSPNALRINFALVLIVTGARVIMVGKRSNIPEEGKLKLALGGFYLRLVALATGGLAGLLGISGGVVLGPFFYRMGLVLPEASGTSSMCGFVIGVSATISYLLLGVMQTGTFTAGYIYWPAFFGVSIASVTFAPIGARMSQLIPRRLSRLLFSVLLVAVAVGMFLTSE